MESSPEISGSAPTTTLRLLRTLGWLLAATDAAAFAVALVSARLLLSPGVTWDFDFILVLTSAPFLLVAVFAGFHLYSVHRFTPAEEFRRLVLATSIAVSLLATVSFWTQATLSRAVMATSWVFSLALVLASRRAWHWWMGKARADGRLALRTVIVGPKRQAMEVARKLWMTPFGFRPLGIVISDGSPADTSRLSVLGTLEDLIDIISTYRVECLFAVPDVEQSELSRMLRAARLGGAEVRAGVNLPEMLSSRLSPQLFGSLSAMSLRPARLTGVQRSVKRVLDITVSGVTLLLALPVMVLVAAAVKLQDGGPVLFRQPRLTKGHRVFNIVKFRTMSEAAERGVQEDRRAAFFKLRADPRITKVGRFLRRTSLDELPQLWNVFKGDMSLVGPRPLTVEQVLAHRDLLTPRLDAPAGMTGWWQINGRSDLDAEEAVRLDHFYIENWSLSLDAYILIKTMGAILKGRGAV